jgi:hypothetical protein
MTVSSRPKLDATRAAALQRWTASRAAVRLAWPSIDIWIPDLLLFEDKTTHDVVRVMAWPENVPTIVIPEAADYVVVRRDLLALGVTPPSTEKPGLLARETVISIVGDRAQRIEEPAPHWIVRGDLLLVRGLRGRSDRAASEFRAVTAAACDVVDQRS